MGKLFLLDSIICVHFSFIVKCHVVDNCVVWEQKFVRDGNVGYQAMMLDNIIEKMDDRTELMLFPMIHGQSKGDNSSFHWTLLVFDLKEVRWSHSNSFNPRGKKKYDMEANYCLAEAYILVSDIIYMPSSTLDYM